jgi:hypothetical protein
MVYGRGAEAMINPNAIREEFGYSVVCLQCKKVFEAQRASAEFCSASCRAKHHRAKRRRQEAIVKAKDAVRLVIANMPWEGESDEYLALQHIKTLILRGLSSVQEK